MRRHCRDHRARALCIRSLASRVRPVQPLADIAPNVEAEALHRGVEAGLEDAAAHPALHALADRPVLPVHEIPEVDGIGWIEAGLRDLVRMEEKVAVDRGVLGTARPHGECSNMVGREADQEVRIDELTLVTYALVVAQPGERLAHARAAMRERPRALGVLDPALPVQLRSAAHLEARHNLA